MMKCPVCDESMREIERLGVTIDICPGCKGVWLDRGELDKIIEMGRGEAPAKQAPPPEPREEQPRPDDDARRTGPRDTGRGRPQRCESFLENLFDVFGGD